MSEVLAGDVGLAALVLGHGVVGLLLLLVAPLGRRARRIGVPALALLGTALASVLASGRSWGWSWRGLELSPGPVLVVALASGAAWVLVAVLQARPGAAALAGVGTAALGMAALTEWLVPFLLFWLLGSLAVAGMALGAPRGPSAWVGVAVADLVLVLALLLQWTTEEEWALPSSAAPEVAWLIRLAALARVLSASLIPAREPGGEEAAAVPLLAGGSFLLLMKLAPGPEPWTSGLFLALGSGLLLRRRSGGGVPVAAGAGAVLLGLGVAGAPGGLVAAGAAAALTLASAALPRAGPWMKGLLIAMVPPGAGFVAVLAAGGAVVAARGESPAWALCALLLPVSLGAAALAVVRSIRTPEPAHPDPVVTAAGALFLFVAVLTALVPGTFPGLDRAAQPDPTRYALLAGIAAAAAALAALPAWRKRPAVVVAELASSPEEVTLEEPAPASPASPGIHDGRAAGQPTGPEAHLLEEGAGSLQVVSEEPGDGEPEDAAQPGPGDRLARRRRGLVVTAGAAFLVAVGIAAFLTLEGLRVGFL